MIWVLLCLSFVCTSAVHGFYPFRPARPTVFLELDPILQLNMLVTALGFAASACCAVLYLRGRHRAAVTALLVLALVLLVPNDACKNTFNRWWIAHLGASPLMFVPNQFAIVFGTAALIGVDRRLTSAALCIVALSVGLLGLGHMWHVIW